MLNFERIDGSSLYQANDDGEPIVGVQGTLTYLLPDGAQTPDELSADESWQSGGYYLALTALPEDPNAFTTAAYQELPVASHASMAWVSGDPDDASSLAAAQLLELTSGGGDAETASETTWQFRQMSVEASAGALVTFTGEGLELEITGEAIEIHPSNGVSPVPVTSFFQIPLTGDDAGALSFDLEVGQQDLGADAFDVSLRYFYTDSDDTLTSLHFPIFELDSSESMAWIGTLYPIDRTASSFALTSGSSFGSTLRTTAGHGLELGPQTGARLAFTPWTAANGDARFYLPAAGSFDLTHPSADELELLCGLSGTEYVVLPAGSASSVQFVPGQAAYAPAFQSQDIEDEPLLDDQGGNATTSWLIPASDGGAVYSAQPEGAPLYSTDGDVPAGGNFLGYLETVTSDLGNLTSGGLPWVFFSGVAENVDDDVWRQYEQDVIAPARRQQIRDLATASDAPANSMSAGAEVTTSATTPQGLLVNVVDGAWQDLTFGVNDGLTLELAGLTAACADSLQSNQLFLVATLQDALAGSFANRIEIQDWPFEIGMSANQAGSADYSNVLIFKYREGPIDDLVDDTRLWADAGEFNDDPDAVQAWLRNYLDEARTQAASDSKYYGSFVDLIDNPSWTGILALRVDVPASDLPESLLGLLPGLDTNSLVAEYLAIDSSKVDVVGSGLQMSRSSLSGLVDYPDDGTRSSGGSDAYDIEVLVLRALFSNSELIAFDSNVELTMNELFGEAATWSGNDDALVISGTYEQTDDEDEAVPLYAFTFEGTGTFQLDGEVIESVRIAQVQLNTTVNTSDDGTSTLVSSEFSFWGDLAFGNLGNFDFFSFDRLSIAGLKLGMSFPLDAPQDTSFLFDPGDIRFDIQASQARQDSLLGNFPLRIDKFVFTTSDDGFSISDMGYLEFPSPIEGAPLGTNPTYGLSFLLNLGSMGGLVSEQEGFSLSVIAGWRPGGGDGGLIFGILLPESSGGKQEIGIQGVLTLSVNDFALIQLQPPAGSSETVYALMMSDASLQVLGARIPPQGDFSVLLFADPESFGSLDLSNVGWYVDYQDTVGADSVLRLDYLGLGQRISLPGSAQTVEEVLDEMAALIPNGVPEDELVEQLWEIYNPDAGWLAGTKFTLYNALYLGAVFADPSTYGLLVGFESGTAGQLGGFNFQILYNKINDTVGVYQIELTLPDAIRQLNFGAVAVTLPIVATDIYTNGDFRIDFGFPENNDFSRSFSAEAGPFIGSGGFYFSKLSAATATRLPEATAAGTFEPVLEFGLGLRLGIGRTVEKGILRAGATITYQGIIEGVAAWWVPDGSGSADIFGEAPEYYALDGQLAIVGELYGNVDFGIIQAAVTARASAGLGVRFEAYEALQLFVEIAVAVAVEVVIGSIRVFWTTVEVTVSFEFETRVRFNFTIGESSQAPWDAVAGAKSRSLATTDQGPIEWTQLANPIYDPPRATTLYFTPQNTVAESSGEPVAQCVVTLTIPRGADASESAEFDFLLRALIAWSVALEIDPETEDPLELTVTAAGLEDLADRLNEPASLAQTTTAPLDYQAITTFLADNFALTVAAVQEGTSFAATTFPILPNLIVEAQDEGDPNTVTRIEFQNQTMRDNAYQNGVAEYFGELLVDYEAKTDSEASGGTGTKSLATILFEAYFGMLIKSGVDQALQALEASGEDSMQLGDLLDATQQAGGFDTVASMAARFSQYGLQLPEDEEIPEDRNLWPELATAPLYALSGQQFPMQLTDDFVYTVRLETDPNDPPSWFELASEDDYPQITITQDSSGEAIDQLENTVLSTAGIEIRQMSNLEQRSPTYTFRNDLVWRRLDAEREVTDTFSLWPLPPALQQTLIDNGTPDSYYDALRLSLGVGHPGQLEEGAESSGDVGDYSWALSLNLTLRKVPVGSGQPLANTYQIGGTDVAGRGLLELMLEEFDSNTVQGLDLLFDLADDELTGLYSEDVDPREVLLLQTNLSTRSAPAPAAPTSAAALAEVATGGVYLATMNDAEAFLRLIWEVSIVNGGGYYLYYENSAGAGLPEELFDSDGQASATLVVNLGSSTIGNTHAFANALITTGEWDDADGFIYAEATELSQWNSALAPGAVGFELRRPNPEAQYSTPSVLLAPGEEPRRGLRRKDVVAALLEHGLEPSKSAYHAALQEVDDDQIQLENLFNLLTYSIEANDEYDFQASIRGLPVGPMNDDNASEWLYRQAVPANDFTSYSAAAGSPYSGIGAQVTLDFELRDLFGNPMITDQEIAPQTFDLLYFDALAGLGQWPALTTSYRVAEDASSGQNLQVELAFDAVTFTQQGDLEPEELEQTRATYELIRDQLSGPAVVGRLNTSLAPEADFTVDLDLLVSYIDIITDFFDSLENGEQPAEVTPLVLGFTVTDADLAAQTANLFELTVELTVERTDFIDPEAAVSFPQAVAITSAIPPRVSTAETTGGETSEMALTAFAQELEATFPELKVATGVKTTAGMPVWAARLAIGEASGSGANAGINVDFGTAPWFFAPPPLSNSLITRRTQITEDESQVFQTFSDVDLDVWAVDFLAAVDNFLSAEYAVPAAQLDLANGRSDYLQVVESKQELAAAIASAVTSVLQSTDGTAGGDLAEAQETFLQRVLVNLSSAYDVSTVVQYRTVVTNSDAPAGLPPNLYGQVEGENTVADENATDAEKVGFSLSSGKVALPDGTSWLTFLYTAEKPTEDTHTPIAMRYRLTHIEHQIEASQIDSNYNSSSWLTLVQPLTVEVDESDIPVPLREFPTPPSLTEQTAVAGVDPPVDLADAKAWNYSYTYQQIAAEQDTLSTHILFNTALPTSEAALVEDSPFDLFDRLAQFLTLYPTLRPQLDRMARGQQDEEVVAALTQFSQAVRNVADAWQPWVSGEEDSTTAASIAPETLQPYEYGYRINENRSLVDDQITLEVSKVPGAGSSVDDMPFPDLYAEGQLLAPDEVTADTAIYTYDPGGGEATPSTRSLVLNGFDVIDTENAWSGVQGVRNLELISREEAAARELETHPSFIYQTTMMRLSDPATPLLDVAQPFDIADEVGTATDSLEAYLQALFQILFGEGNPDQLIEIAARYGYDLRGGQPPATGPGSGSSFTAYLPILMTRPVVYQADADPALAAELAAAIDAWRQAVQPSDAGGMLVLDLSVYAALTESELPVLRLRNLWLGIEHLESGAGVV